MSQPSLDLQLPDDAAEPTYRVAELAAAIDQALRRSFRDGVWVRGEIEGLRADRNGHTWFRLCERGEAGAASLGVVLFGGTAARLAPLLRRHRLRLGDGMQVRIFVEVDFHAASGRLTLKMAGLDPTYTLGRLAADRDQLLRRLVAEGLLDAQKRLVVPACPYRIGLVTSVGSAAWHDVTHELERSGLAWRVVAADTAVQGPGAERAVAAALRALGSAGPVGTLGAGRVDVIALVRGGGSRTDLATFDAEAVARTIAGLAVPVITGLGHEIDRAVADEVAHLALKTPTAVAAWLVEQAGRHQRAAETCWSTITARALAQLDRHTAALVTRGHRLAARTHAVVGRADERLAADGRRLGQRARAAVASSQGRTERDAGRLEGAARRHATAAGRDLDRLAARLARAAPQAVVGAERELTGLAARVAALDPARALARGWSITRTSAGGVVTSASDVSPGGELITTLADGRVRSRVEEVGP